MTSLEQSIKHYTILTQRWYDTYCMNVTNLLCMAWQYKFKDIQLTNVYMSIKVHAEIIVTVLSYTLKVMHIVHVCLYEKLIRWIYISSLLMRSTHCLDSSSLFIRSLHWLQVSNVVLQGGKSSYVSHKVDTVSKQLTIQLSEKTDTSVSYTLSIDFEGPLKDDLTGLYLSEYRDGNTTK